MKVKLSVKVKLFVSLLCVYAILPEKAVPEMICAMSGEMLNPTHSLAHSLYLCLSVCLSIRLCVFLCASMSGHISVSVFMLVGRP